jgi:hypothetical protein
MLVTPFNQQSVRAIIRGATLPVASTERHRLTNAEHDQSTHFHPHSSRGIGALRAQQEMSGSRFVGPMPRSVAFFAVPNFLQ